MNKSNVSAAMNLKSSSRIQNSSPPNQTAAFKNIIVLQSLDPRSKSPVTVKSPPKTARTSSPLQSSRVSYQNKTPEPHSSRNYGVSDTTRKASAPKLNSVYKAPPKKINDAMGFSFQKKEEPIPVQRANKVEQSIDDSIENTVSRLMSLICSHNLQDNGIVSHRGNNTSINQMFSDMSFRGNGISEQMENVYNLETEKAHKASRFSDYDASQRAKTLPTKEEPIPQSIENVYHYTKDSPVQDTDRDLCYSDIEEFKRMQAQLTEKGNHYIPNNQETFGYGDIFKGKRLTNRSTNIYSQKERNTPKPRQSSNSNNGRRLSPNEGEEFLNAYSNIASKYAGVKKSPRTEKSINNNTPRKSPVNLTVKSNNSRSKSPTSTKPIAQPKTQNLEYLKNKKASPIKKPQSRDSSLSNRRPINTHEDITRLTENDEIPKSGRKSAAYNYGKGETNTGRLFDKNANLGLMSSVDMVKHCQALIKKAKFLPPKHNKKLNIKDELDF